MHEPNLNLAHHSFLCHRMRWWQVCGWWWWHNFLPLLQCCLNVPTLIVVLEIDFLFRPL